MTAERAATEKKTRRRKIVCCANCNIFLLLLVARLANVQRYVILYKMEINFSAIGEKWPAIGAGEWGVRPLEVSVFAGRVVGVLFRVAQRWS